MSTRAHKIGARHETIRRARGPRVPPDVLRGRVAVFAGRGVCAVKEELQLFLRHVRLSDCIEWIGARTSGGYGKFWSQGKCVPAHRWSYRLLVGEIPKGLELDHLCRNRSCVNPLHLEPVTRTENVRRGVSGIVNAARKLAQTSCPSGHPYAGENLKIVGGYRRCRECANQHLREWRARKKREHVSA